MKSTINKIIDIEAALVQKSTGLLTKINDLSYTEEDPINKKLSDILALFSVSKDDMTVTAPVLHMIDGGYDNVDALGDYYLIDINATGIDRVWKHESKEYYIKINEASTSSPRGVEWHVTDGTNKKCTWAVNVLDNPYNDDGSSLQWNDAYWPVPLPNIIMTEQTYSITADDAQPETSVILVFTSYEHPALPGQKPSQDCDGNYYLVNPAAQGWYRVWKHETKDYYISARYDGMDNYWDITSVPNNYPTAAKDGISYAFIQAYNYPDPWLANGTSDSYTPWDKIKWPTDTIFRITIAEI